MTDPPYSSPETPDDRIPAGTEDSVPFVDTGKATIKVPVTEVKSFSSMTAQGGTNTSPEAAPPRIMVLSDRLLSVDALRGLTIVLMILVNNFPVDDPSVLLLTHAPWNGGVYIADFVFPWFLFCVGLAVPYSYASFMKKALPWYRYAIKVVQRMIVLVFLGCLLESAISKHVVIGLGVLQIIGLAYMVGALLYGFSPVVRLTIAAVFLIGYAAALKLIPVPGCEPGVFKETENIIYYINMAYLAPFHIKGILSVIPTTAMVLLGASFGDVARDRSLTHEKKLLHFFIGGALLTCLSLVWNTTLPYNKTVWTPSYIVLMAGTGAMMLGFLYLIIDRYGWRSWAYPLIVFGSNAIVAYVVPILFKILVLQVVKVSAGDGTMITLQQWLLNLWTSSFGLLAGGWFYILSYILFWWLILWVLYLKRWFIRV
jgi:predicted acyltransferase